MRLAPVFALALLFAGCVVPAAEVDAPPGPAAAPRDAAPGLALPAGSVSGGAEPTILAMRSGTLFIGDTSGLWRSRDAGATWQEVPVPFLGGLFTDGYALAEDDVGTLYVGATNGQLVSLAASEDEGATWRVTHVVDAAPVADRPWVAARGDGEVAFLYYDTKMLKEACLASVDGGRTFLTRYVGLGASPNAGNAEFGPDGALYYAISNVVYRWDEPCVGDPKRMLQGASGASIFTQVAVSDEGDVFVARPTPGNGALILSGTHGMSGATRKTILLTPPEIRSSTFAAISEQDGEIAVAWYGSETAGDPSGAFQGAWNVHVARVTGFWSASPVVERVAVTGEPNHVGGFCMSGIACTDGDRDLLDYFGVDHAPDGSVHVAYGHDGAGSAAEVRYASLPPR